MPLRPLLPCRYLISAWVVALPAQPAHTSSAQTPRLPVHHLTPPTNTRLRPLRAGDTVYVVASFLNIRPRPQADGPGNPLLYMGRNRQGTVVAVPNRNWALVLFTSEDVGIEGYASQWYLARQEIKPSR